MQESLYLRGLHKCQCAAAAVALRIGHDVDEPAVGLGSLLKLPRYLQSCAFVEGDVILVVLRVALRVCLAVQVPLLLRVGKLSHHVGERRHVGESHVGGGHILLRQGQAHTLPVAVQGLAVEFPLSSLSCHKLVHGTEVEVECGTRLAQFFRDGVCAEQVLVSLGIVEVGEAVDEVVHVQSLHHLSLFLCTHVGRVASCHDGEEEQCRVGLVLPEAVVLTDAYQLLGGSRHIFLVEVGASTLGCMRHLGTRSEGHKYDKKHPYGTDTVVDHFLNFH